MSSDNESANEWTVEKIDLDKPLVDLHSVVDDRSKLAEALFDYLNKDELSKIFSHSKNEKKDDLDFEYLKEICTEQLERIPKKKIIKLLDLELDGVEADIDLGGEDLNEEEEIENKESPDDLQMNVDDEEYEEFLNAEFNNSDSNKEINKEETKDDKSKAKISLSKKDQQKLINELAFPSATEGEILDHCKVDSMQNETGWQNLWNQTQQEIQELKMRANAIKVMMAKSKQESDRNLDDSKNGSATDRLLDNIESDDDYLSVEEERESSHRSPSNKKSPTEKESKSSEERINERRKDSRSVESVKSHKRNRKTHQPDEPRDHYKDRYRRERYPENHRREHHKRTGHYRESGKLTFVENQSDDEERQIERAVEDEYLDIKITQREYKKLSTRKLEEKRISMESGEIVDDEEDLEELRAIRMRSRRLRSPSFTSSIDSFGRQRRRHRSERRRHQSERSLSDSDSFSSLDEVLREVELEEQMEKPSKSHTDRESGNKLKHHHQSKKLHTPDERHAAD